MAAAEDEKTEAVVSTREVEEFNELAETETECGVLGILLIAAEVEVEAVETY